MAKEDAATPPLTPEQQALLELAKRPYKEILSSSFTILKPDLLLEKVYNAWGEQGNIDPQPTVSVDLPPDYSYYKQFVTGKISLAIDYPFPYIEEVVRERTRINERGRETSYNTHEGWRDATGHLRVILGLMLTKTPTTDQQIKAFVETELTSWTDYTDPKDKSIPFDPEDPDKMYLDYEKLVRKSLGRTPFPWEIANKQRIYNKAPIILKGFKEGTPPPTKQPNPNRHALALRTPFYNPVTDLLRLFKKPAVKESHHAPAAPEPAHDDHGHGH